LSDAARRAGAYLASMTRTHVLLFVAAGLALAALVSGGTTGGFAGGGRAGSGGVVPPGSAPLPSTAPAGQRTQLFRGQGAGMTLEARLSADRVLGGSSTVYLDTNVLAAQSELKPTRVPVNLALALDRSGSMSGNKLEQAKRAAQALVGALTDGDRLAVISFGSDVTVYPSTRIDASTRAELLRWIGGIQDSGGTNISGALEAASEQLRRSREGYKVSRVILLSDGQPTEGRTSAAELKDLVAAARRDDITTSAFGVGLDFNSRLMSDLAGAGAGNYAFIEDANHLAPMFEKDLLNAAATLARNVELELRPKAGVALADVPGHEWRSTGSGYRVPLYDFAGGQTAQALLRLDLTGVPAEGHFAFGELVLRFVRVSDGTVQEVPVAFSAEATSSSSEVQAHSDALMVETVQKMEVAKQLASAAAAYESGDRDKAVSIFDGIRRQFGMSADALAGDDLTAVQGRMRQGGSTGAAEAKQLTNKTMKSFGQNNTY
jgi:Ca-activated chloride channel homolog